MLPHSLLPSLSPCIPSSPLSLSHLPHSLISPVTHLSNLVVGQVEGDERRAQRREGRPLDGAHVAADDVEVVDVQAEEHVVGDARQVAVTNLHPVDHDGVLLEDVEGVTYMFVVRVITNDVKACGRAMLLP